MSSKQHVTVKVTEEIRVDYDGGDKVALSLSRHLDDNFATFFSQGLLLSPSVAGRLGQALLEVATTARAAEARSAEAVTA